MQKITFFLLCSVFLAFSCKKDEKGTDDSIKIEISTISKGNTVKINDELQHVSGHLYKLSSLKFYISNIRLINHKGDDIPFQMDNIPGSEQGVFLYWMGKNENFSGSLPDDHYTKIKFDLGLAPVLNDLNPNQFAANHPLSRDTDMYWDMLKYRFLFYEGLLDNTDDGTYKLPFSYHLGGSDFLRTVEKDINLNVSGKKKVGIPLNIDMDKIFTGGTNSIDILNFFSYHSGNDNKETGLKMMDFAAKAFE